MALQPSAGMRAVSRPASGSLQMLRTPNMPPPARGLFTIFRAASAGMAGRMNCKLMPSLCLRFFRSCLFFCSHCEAVLNDSTLGHDLEGVQFALRLAIRTEIRLILHPDRGSQFRGADHPRSLATNGLVCFDERDGPRRRRHLRGLKRACSCRFIRGSWGLVGFVTPIFPRCPG